MKTKLVLFAEDFFDAGNVKFAAGQYYPDSDETRRFVPAIASLVEVDLSVEHAEKLANKARAAADRAAAAAAEAEQLAEAARVAQQLADEAMAALELSGSDAGQPADPALSAAAEGQQAGGAA